MRLEAVDDIVIYDINTPQKFDIVQTDLMRTVKIMEDHKVMNNMFIGDYINILRKQLETKYEKFKLLVAIRECKVVGFMAAFIATDDNQQDVCLIYGSYFFPGLLAKILSNMLYHLDLFAKDFGCTNMQFGTSRNREAYARLLNKYQFEPTKTIFERRIN